MIVIKEESLKIYLKNKSFSENIYDEIINISETRIDSMYGVISKSDALRKDGPKCEFDKLMYEGYEDAYDMFTKCVKENKLTILTEDIEIVLDEYNPN